MFSILLFVLCGISLEDIRFFEWSNAVGRAHLVECRTMRREVKWVSVLVGFVWSKLSRSPYVEFSNTAVVLPAN